MVMQRSHKTTGNRPDAAAFVRLIDEGLAQPADVLAAYRHALKEWAANGGTTPIEIVAERPMADPDSAEGRLIRLARELTFKGAGR